MTQGPVMVLFVGGPRDREIECLPSVLSHYVALLRTGATIAYRLEIMRGGGDRELVVYAAPDLEQAEAVGRAWDWLIETAGMVPEESRR